MKSVLSHLSILLVIMTMADSLVLDLRICLSVFQPVTNFSSFQNCCYPDNHTIRTTIAPLFTLLTMFVVAVAVAVAVAVVVVVVVKALYYIAIVFEANITGALIGEAQLNARALFSRNGDRPITNYAN